MALGGADQSLHHRKIRDPRRRHFGRRADQHGHVEMILEQGRGLDRPFVAAVDEDRAVAGEADEGNLGRGFGRRREQRRHLGAGAAAVRRPAGGLADVGVADLGAARRGGVRRLRKQRRFLGAADGQRRARCGGLAEGLELGAAELVRGRNLAAATAAAHGLGIERHRVVARADQDVAAPIGHARSGVTGPGGHHVISIPGINRHIGTAHAVRKQRPRAHAACGCA